MVNLCPCTGFAKNNKRTKRGSAKHQVCFVPLQVRASDKRTLLWKNEKPNSNRHTKIIRSKWCSETAAFILESHESLEAEIQNLQPMKMVVNNVTITVNYSVQNCMNDGKVIHAVATQFYKTNKLISETSKSLSFQTCHLCGRNMKEFQTHFHIQKATFAGLRPLGFAPLHCAKNSRECLLKAAFRKHSEKSTGNRDTASVKASQDLICEKVRLETGARLFEPEPEKKGNSNTGANLKLITKFAHKTAPILDCSEELLFLVHELLGMIESLDRQDPEVMKNLPKRIFELYQEDFGAYSKLSPSFHRALIHSAEFASYYQSQGFTIGEMSETAQEAINAPTKLDVAKYSFRGSHEKQNLGCFRRNWALNDPFTLEYAE